MTAHFLVVLSLAGHMQRRASTLLWDDRVHSVVVAGWAWLIVELQA